MREVWKNKVQKNEGLLGMRKDVLQGMFWNWRAIGL